MKRVERGEASAGRAPLRAGGAGGALRANEGTNGFSVLRSRRASCAPVGVACAGECLPVEAAGVTGGGLDARAASGGGASTRAAMGAVVVETAFAAAEAGVSEACAAPGAAVDGATCGVDGVPGVVAPMVNVAAASTLLARDAVGARLRGVVFGTSEADAAVDVDARLRGAFACAALSSASLFVGRERVRGAGASSLLRAVRLRGAGGFSSSMRESVTGPAR